MMPVGICTGSKTFLKVRAAKGTLATVAETFGCVHDRFALFCFDIHAWPGAIGKKDDDRPTITTDND